ncbi:beta-ketoacyl synthase N-terminal-like domain-containing protein [Pseudanabaena mucicola]|uniref:Beta-ketoacyl-ACP reductase n=1 Tax=Pseudanabaena mucicola FACHB-723 TaxID=2692860 RepID=A0ABR7ZVB1_9CYAN|nr:beta-ketoacyl synthase N-terminal-like domain-containing protein [Pseudanabaena mucicola]MBD2187348.1 beta-ketoacyl-ACP reductase [Pseudanabaena mucicola FACHB-723]
MKSLVNDSDNTVVVTGIGIVTAIGADRESTWQKLLQGKSGIEFDQQLELPLARIHSSESSLESAQFRSRSQFLLHKATIAAITDANMELPAVNCGVVIGSSRSHQRELELLLDQYDQHDQQFINHIDQFGQYWRHLQPATLSAHIAQLIQTQSPVFAPMAACATANWAIAQASELIRAGRCEIAIAGATDAAITPLTIAGFQKIGVLAKSGVHPFSQERSGFALGEGAATLVLESLSSAKKRGGKIYGHVLGWGITNDAYHATSPNPDNQMAAVALQDCLLRSQITPADIGYINVHGTATMMNDAREANLIQQFCPHAAVSGTKGATGHSLGATGMIEAAFCLLALRDRQLPPCVGMRTPAFDLSMVSQSESAPNLQYALNFSFGFGGQNAIIAFGQI